MHTHLLPPSLENLCADNTTPNPSPLSDFQILNPTVQLLAGALQHFSFELLDPGVPECFVTLKPAGTPDVPRSWTDSWCTELEVSNPITKHMRSIFRPCFLHLSFLGK